MNNKAEKLKRYLYLIPVLIAVTLFYIFIFNPEFYLNYVLSGYNREAQAVETLTFFPALLASLILFKNFFRLKQLPEYKKPALFMGIIGLATFFFAGEESSWGQSYFHWITPEFYDCTSVETNIHNSPFPLHNMGSLFIISVFLIVPLIWKKKKPFQIPETYKPVIAEGPVIFCIAFGYLWKLLKSAYRFLLTREELANSFFYTYFAEQINEQKEMFIAIGLLIYAFYKDSVVKKIIQNKNNT